MHVPSGQHAMRNRIALGLTLVALAGCAPGPYGYGPPGYAGSGLPQPLPLRYENPSLVPLADPHVVWESVVDAVDNYFRIDREEPVRQIGATLTEGRLETFPEVGATLLEPWRQDSANAYERLESTLQSIRRRAMVRVIPAGGGYLVEVQVEKQLEDCIQPEHARAGAATMRYDNTLTRIVNPVGEQEVTKGWISQGRDAALEQRILGDLEMRVGRLVRPSTAPQLLPQAQPGPAGCAPSADRRTTVPLSTHPMLAAHAQGSSVVESDSTCSPAYSPFRSTTPIYWTAARLPMEPAAFDPPSALPLTVLTTSGDAANEVAACQPNFAAELPLADAAVFAERPFASGRLSLAQCGRDICCDYQNFYSCRGLTLLGLGLGTAAVLANTSLDQQFQTWYQNDVRTESTDDFAKVARSFGSGEYVLPAFAAAALLGAVADESPLAAAVGQWGQRCLRTVLVGGPPVLALQYGLGASRPYESPHQSRWQPFEDNNAVSGHAFIGAIAFLNAAAMSDCLGFKVAMYGLSVLPAWSRLNDNRHYLSQVLLGYGIACLATWAVDTTEQTKNQVVLVPLAAGNAFGVGAMWRI